MSAKTSPIDARVIDQALVASFMNAEPPKVWRADMAKLTTATLELRSEAGRFRLVMIAQSGEEDVAVFNSKEDGTAALQAVMHAMLAPAVTVAGVAAPVATEKKKGGFFRSLLRLLMWFFVIFVAVFILFGLTRGQQIGQLGTMMSRGDNNVIQEGAPAAADEFFR